MGTAAQLAGVAQRAGRARLHGRGDQLPAGAAAQVPRADRRLQGGRPLDARRTPRELKIDPERIGGFGYSAGAHLVSLLGTTDADDGLEGVDVPATQPSTRLQCVAAGGAPCDFRPIPADERRTVVLGSAARRRHARRSTGWPRRRRSSRPTIRRCFSSTASDDQLVPIVSPEHMRAGAASRRASTAELYVVPKLGHIAASMDRGAIDRAIVFLSDHLKPQSVETSATAPASRELERAGSPRRATAPAPTVVPAAAARNTSSRCTSSTCSASGCARTCPAQEILGMRPRGNPRHDQAADGDRLHAGRAAAPRRVLDRRWSG